MESKVAVPDYLKKYIHGPTSEKKKKKKKPSMNNLLLIDTDIKVEAKTQNIEEENEEDAPVIAGEIEEKAPKSFNLGIKDDGSGWTELSTNNQSKARHDSEDEKDLSPPRKATIDEDLSPPRNIRHNDTDLSPPRKRRNDDDQSPPRKRRNDDDQSPPRKKMISGSKTGLLSGREVAEAERKKRILQDAHFAAQDPKSLGKDAATVYRDKKGKRLSINDVIEQMEGKYKTNEEKDMEWGVGLVQKKENEDKKATEEIEKSKPFARHIDDEDLNKIQKDKERWGDPFSGLLKGEKSKKSKKDKKDKKKSKDVVIASTRKWNGIGLANRFNIPPGNMWDGIDRSNGFEAKLLNRANEKKDQDEQRFMSEINDM